ncbi:MAG TPA: alpha-glucuronidase family glycosyl hydrolase [Bryobacteraceae bacterium]|nr:alpha-glucuronidase family glycosyl hydrolase [Bryobacteraceae bacterium]
MKTILLLLLAIFPLRAEDGSAAWLRYTPVDDPALRSLYSQLPAYVVRLGDEPQLISAQQEIIRGFQGMLNRIERAADSPVPDDMILLATGDRLPQEFSTLRRPALEPDGFWLKSTVRDGHHVLLIAGTNSRGVLYGTFDLLRKMQMHEHLNQLDEHENPYAPIRWVNEWDNLNGTIERGYGGRSIFFGNDSVVPNLTRASAYARLLASAGIDGCTVNNVNANPRVLTPEFIPQLARIGDAFRPWGVRLSIAVPFAAPQLTGGLNTFDPLDPNVARWWNEKVNALYQAIPDLAGFELKADSEGQLGPAVYHRTPEEAANMIARALKPHGGILLYRGFVYNHHLDWHDLKADRARAAYDIFHPLDGKFDDNVVVQIKYGPIDFQVREPVSPLIGGLRKTNEALELQIAQEYLGQQRHVVYLVPMWKEILDFDLRVNGGDTLVRDIISGHTFHRPLGGMVGVANVGADANWMGSHMAMANLYGFGRLAWNPDLSARQITREWTEMTFGHDARVDETVSSIQLESWKAYENYTGPLGLQTLTNILGSHYGPNPQSQENNGWGQWIRADHQGVGMDRTVATGTGYIGQYPLDVARIYESIPSTPDNLLLFLHHVPYTYRLHSGDTVIQYIYDAHYAGAAEARQFADWWDALRGRMDDERYNAIQAKLTYQAGHAIVWRDAICNFFYRESGIPDARGRVGHYPDRTEAESMQLTGYQVINVDPWEDASGEKAVICPSSEKSCSAQFTYGGPAGWNDVAVQYFDLPNGSARFQVFVNEQQIAAWSADARLPSLKPNGDNSTRHTIVGVLLHPHDQIRIAGTPDRGDTAGIDYIAIWK